MIKSVFLLFNGELDNDNYDTLMPWSERFGVAYFEKTTFVEIFFSSTKKHRSVILSSSVFRYECSRHLKSLESGVRDEVCFNKFRLKFQRALCQKYVMS